MPRSVAPVMANEWFDFDEMDEKEEAEPSDEEGHDLGPGPDEDPPRNDVLSRAGFTQLTSFEDRSGAVLYDTQFWLPVSAEEFWKFNTATASDTNVKVLDDDGRRTLWYLPNGICMGMEFVAKHSVRPHRMEFHILQVRAGSTLAHARKITSWDELARAPLLRFQSLFENSDHTVEGHAGVLIRRSIRQFEQLEMQETPLGEVVINSINMENMRFIRGSMGPEAAFPPGYVIFNAPATATLLRLAADGKTKPMPSVLEQRGDPNHVCEMEGVEITPLFAAVQARCTAAVGMLLQAKGDANVVCSRGPGPSGMCTALDLAAELQDGEMLTLLRSAGGLPIAKLERPDAGGPSLAGASPADLQSFEAAIGQLTLEMQRIRKLSSHERRGAVRKLMLQWHPDKNRENTELATSVFQWLQSADLQAPRNAGGVSWGTAKADVPALDASVRVYADGPLKTGRMSVAMKIVCRNYALEFFNVLIRQGETIHQLDECGRTALFYSVRGVRSIDGELPEVPPGWSGFTGFDWEPLQKPGCPDMCRILVQLYDADVNARDGAKLTPLMEASRYGNLRAIVTLLELKADIGCRNARGHSALDIARTKEPEYFSIAEACLPTDDGFAWEQLRRGLAKDRRLCAVFLEKQTQRAALTADAGRGRPQALGGQHFAAIKQ